jgi:hypothetical protein
MKLIKQNPNKGKRCKTFAVVAAVMQDDDEKPLPRAGRSSKNECRARRPERIIFNTTPAKRV